MDLSYIQLLNLVVPVYLVIIAGLVLRRTGLLSAEADSSLLRLTINFLAPCLILDSIVGNPAIQSAGSIALPPIVGFSTVCLGYLAGWLASPLFGITDTVSRRTFAVTIGIYNYGFIPLPIVQGLFDRATMGVLFTHNLGVEIAFWGLGVMILRGSGNPGGWFRMLNAPVVAVVVAVLINLAEGGWLLPPFVRGAVHMAGQSAVPLSLILTGATMADWIFRFKPQHFGRVALGSCLLRTALLPVAFLLLAYALPGPVELKRVIVVQSAMPAAMMTIVVAKHYSADAELSLKAVLATSVAGLLTIPLWIRAGMLWLGL